MSGDQKFFNPSREELMRGNCETAGDGWRAMRWRAVLRVEELGASRKLWLRPTNGPEEGIDWRVYAVSSNQRVVAALVAAGDRDAAGLVLVVPGREWVFSDEGVCRAAAAAEVGRGARAGALDGTDHRVRGQRGHRGAGGEAGV